MTRTADEITAELVAWIGAVSTDVQVSANPLGGKAPASGIDLRLLRTTPRPPARTPDPPLIVDLDYLATVRLADGAAEQKAAAELVLAAMARQDVEIVREADVLQLCGALGLPPAPGVVLRAPLVRERDVQRPPRVRQLVVQTARLGVIAGQVLGPKDIPVPDAAVWAVGLERQARTDRDGRFRIDAAPCGRPVRLVARARGAEIEGVGAVGQAVTLRIPLED